MKFGKNLRGDAVPEWRECYLDYGHLKIFILLIKRIVELNEAADHLVTLTGSENNDETSAVIIHSETIIDSTTQRLQSIKVELLQLAVQINILFFDARTKGMDVNRTFVHMKLLQIDNSFEKVQRMKIMPIGPQEKDLLINLMESIYVEISYLEAMKDANLEGERKILKKHKKYASDLVPTPFAKNSRYKRLGRCIDKTLIKIEDIYSKFADGPTKANRQHLRDLPKKMESEVSDSFIFGGWVGVIVTVIIVLIIILAYSGISIETDPTFNRDFPTWRGIAFFIFYIWILGFDVYNFQKYAVSHRIIFEFNQHHYSTSTYIFKTAGFFSTLFLVLFAIYVLKIADIASFNTVHPHYLVAFVWGVFICYLFNPLPIFNHRGRLFAAKMALKSIFSPILGVTFPVIWMTDQLISLVTPFKDFGYTICYYSKIDFSQHIQVSDNYCSSATRVEIVFLVGAIAYSYRIVQCIRQGYDKGAYFFRPEFLNTIKYASSLITLILSYIWKAGDDKVFYGWLFFTIFTTIYSYIWDLKMDWALLEPHAPHRFLRRHLTYLPPRNYYIAMIANLFLRLAWVATLSPAISDKWFGSPQIFSLVTGSLQIFRRGLWNLFRVQKEHLQNCKNFQAIPDTSKHLQTAIITKMQQKTKYSEESFQNILANNMVILANQLQINKINKKKEREKNQFLTVLRGLLKKEEHAKKWREKEAKKMKQRVKDLQVEIQSMYARFQIQMPKLKDQGKDDE